MIDAPMASSIPGVPALIVPCVPTGMNAGVSITPWEVVIRPRRARDDLDLDVMTKLMGTSELYPTDVL